MELDIAAGTGGLVQAVAAALGRHPSAEAAQEGLDLLAAAEGLKPAAVLGFAGDRGGSLDALEAAAGAHGLATRRCGGWISAGELTGVPSWYEEAVEGARAATLLLVVALRPAVLGRLSGEGPVARLDVAAEAALLGYPACCVAEHAAWRRAGHQALAAMILAAAKGDERRAGRLAAAGWEPAPADAAARARLSGLTRATAPFTGIVMCGGCARVPGSPAKRLSGLFGELAQRAGLSRLLRPSPAA